METENIDLLVILEKLWHRKKAIFAWTGGCLAVGVVLIFLSPRKYEAACVIQWELPENSRQVSPSLYPDIFYSDAFLRELSRCPLEVTETGDMVSYLSVVAGGNTAMADTGGAEQLCVGRLRGGLSVAVDMNERCLTVSAEMSDPKLAALLAEQARLLLEKTVREEGGKKVGKVFGAIEKRYLRMKEELQLRRQRLTDSLERIASLSASRREVGKKILLEDYDLFYSLYSDCAREYERARIQYQDDRLILEVVKPVTEPAVPSRPRPRLLLAASLFLGFLLGIGWALLVPERRRK